MLQLAEGTGSGTGHSAWDLRPGPSVEMSFYQRLSAGYRQWHLLGQRRVLGTLVSKNFIAPLVLVPVLFLFLLLRFYFIHNIILNVSLHSG